MLSCSSTKPSIWGVALSWKYIPHALGASKLILILKILFIYKLIILNSLLVFIINKYKLKINSFILSFF